MSGVFGYFGTAQDASTLASQMERAMRHEHASGVVVAAADARRALGHIGAGPLHGSAQFAQADGTVSLCMCGEFYYQDQRRAELARASTATDDAALALDIYIREGAAGLTRMDGAFVIAISDGRSHDVFLINDRFGLYQHFYAHIGNTFTFAPEIKALLVAPEIPRQLDFTAVAQYIRFQQLLGERTWLEDVHLLPPGTLLRYRPDDNTLSVERYWDWDHIKPAPHVTLNEAVEETIRLFQRTIDEMTRPPLKVGVYLSGGLDGRTILGFIDQHTPVTTMTFGAPGCRDVVYGTELAQRAGRPHHWFPFENGQWVLDHVDQHLALTDGLHSWVNLHGISTLNSARQHIDVHLSGWDGGTTMGGRLDEYDTDPNFRHTPDEATFTQRLFDGFCQTFTWPGLTNADADALCGGIGQHNLPQLARESFAAEVARSAHYPQPYRADYFYILQRVRRSTQNMIVFQRSAFEVRCPFFDYALVDFLYSLPEPIRNSAMLHRSVITRRMPALAMVPYDKDDRLPHTNPFISTGFAALQKAKRAVNKLAGPVFPQRPRLYADYENYLRTDLRPWAEQILFDARTLDRGLFDPAVVKQLWQRHQKGDKLWTMGSVAPLITLEMVTRYLIDDTF